MTPEENYLAIVAELQALARNAPHVTQADILEIASMPADELRRRAIRQRDWAGHWSHCLDGLGVWKMSGAAPDGCWMPREVRSVVEQLLARTPDVLGTSEIGKRSTSAATASGHELPNLASPPEQAKAAGPGAERHRDARQMTAATAEGCGRVANGGDARVASAGRPAGDRLRDLIDRYWSLAHAEGKEGRAHDTEDGAAQQCRHEIEEILRGLDGVQEVPNGS